MDESTKTKHARSAAGTEKRTSYRAVWLKGQRHVNMQAQVHEQWKLLKTNGKLQNESDLAAYLISLEFRGQERYTNHTFHGPPFYKTQRFVNSMAHTRRLSRTRCLCTDT